MGGEISRREDFFVQTLHGALRAVLIQEGREGHTGKFMSCFHTDGEQGWQNVLSTFTVSQMP